MEEEPESFQDSNGTNADQNDAFEDFIKVPENVPEVSSSPEMIGIDDQDEDHGDAEEPVLPVTKRNEGTGELRNLEREPDHEMISPPILPEFVPESPPYTGGGIEDVFPKGPSTASDGSPSRPGTKTVETPRATGYLSFLNALPPVVLYLIYWCDPKLTLLSLVLSMVVLLTLYVNTFLHTITLLLLAAMVTSLLYIVTKVAIDSFYNRPIVNPFSKYLEKDLTFPEEKVIEIAKLTARILNCRLRFLVNIVFFANTLRSLKFMVVLFLSSYVTNCFDVFTTLFLGIIGLHTIPFVYKKYQSSIDTRINSVLFKLTNMYSKIVEKVPFLPKLKSD